MGERIVFGQKSIIEISTNLVVLHIPESEKPSYATLSVCLYVCVNTLT